MRMPFTAAALMALGLVASPARAEDHDEAWAQRQVRRIKDSDTTEWTRIPWAGSLLDAERTAKDENRPVFLFTHDGNLETGRC